MSKFTDEIGCSAHSSPFPLGSTRSVIGTIGMITESVSEVTPTGTPELLVCGNSGDLVPEDQGMYVVGALVGLHRLEIEHVPAHRVFMGDTICTEQISGRTSDFQCFDRETCWAVILPESFN